MNYYISFQINSPEFSNTIMKIDPNEEILVVILNQHASNMTFNWLCNTANMDRKFNLNIKQLA